MLTVTVADHGRLVARLTITEESPPEPGAPAPLGAYDCALRDEHGETRTVKIENWPGCRERTWLVAEALQLLRVT